MKKKEPSRDATLSSQPSIHSASSAPTSTSQRVSKMTPAVALVTLKTSIDTMTDAIVTSASKPFETAEDWAAGQHQQAVRLVQEREDGLSTEQKGILLTYFSSHSQHADMYVELNDNDLRCLMIAKWIAAAQGES
jgi:hypothetical protein